MSFTDNTQALPIRTGAVGIALAIGVQDIVIVFATPMVKVPVVIFTVQGSDVQLDNVTSRGLVSSSTTGFTVRLNATAAGGAAIQYVAVMRESAESA